MLKIRFADGYTMEMTIGEYLERFGP